MKPKVVPATAEGFFQAADDRKTGRICADLADMLEQKLRGEMTEDEYKEAKGKLKRGCRFYTPHAHFNKGYKRSDGEPVDSGKAVIDMDGCADFAQRYEQHLKGREKELGINMVNISVSSTGGHVLFDIPEGLSREEAQQWMAHLMGDVAYDKAVHEAERAIYIPCREYILYIDEALMFGDELHPAEVKSEESPLPAPPLGECKSVAPQMPSTPPKGEVEGAGRFPTAFRGISYSVIISEFFRRTGGEPKEGERNKRLHQLAANLRAVCDNSEAWLLELMPRYGLSEEEMRSIIHSACKEPTKGSRLMDQIVEELAENANDNINVNDDEDNNGQCSMLNVQWDKLPQGVKESVESAEPQLAMSVLTAICPAIGALATGVKLDVHDQKKGLNLIAYIAGDFASGKGSIDPVVDAWMSEVKATDNMYLQQEDEWRAKKRAAKNKKEQPEEPKLPVRCLPLNNTVANLAERLANTEGKHGFSFTPEADTLAQKWKNAMSDFSVMLRQSYDGSRYDREAKSADAVNVHIDHLLWNVTMCGTPDALYRVVSNYTDGFQSRIALARTPDNTFMPLSDKPSVLTDLQSERIQQVAHLLPLMQGEIVLPKLEARGREWLERVRLESMKSDDKVRARQRFRICVTAQRMTCCLMLCKVSETLIGKHGLNGAEKRLKTQPELWKEMLVRTQTEPMLELYDTIADSLMDNALYFFRERIENAFASRDYAGGANSERQRAGKNDTIFDRLDVQFTFDQAMQFSVAVKGAGVTHNSVRQMLKNWRKQGLVLFMKDGRYSKVSG